MIGQRGVPASFGGIERHVEELGSRLAARGHDVVVYARTNYVAEPVLFYRGMKVVLLPTVGTKHLDAIVHSGLSTASALTKRFDIVHYHGLGPGLLAPLPKWLSNSKVVFTLHGRDDERAKWNRAARTVLRTGWSMSRRIPDAVITVSQNLEDAYAAAGRKATYIPNGVTTTDWQPDPERLRSLGLEPGRYLLFVGRFVPEKAPDLLLRAFRRITDPSLILALVGGSSFTGDYMHQLESLAATDCRVRLTGYQYGPMLDELYFGATAFILPSALEGSALTLLEAAGRGIPVVASDIPPNVEVLGREEGPGRRLFASGDENALVAALHRALADPVAERAGAAALQLGVMARYSWDQAAIRTEQIYNSLLGAPAIPAERLSDRATTSNEIDLRTAARNAPSTSDGFRPGWVRRGTARQRPQAPGWREFDDAGGDRQEDSTPAPRPVK